MVNALEFLERHRNWKFPYFQDTPLEHQLGWRAVGFSLWTHGNISFMNALRNAAVPPFKSQEVMKRVWDAVTKVFIKDVVQEGLPRDGMEVFGHPFHIGNDRDDNAKWVATFKTLNESIASDQYRIKKYLKPNAIVVDAGANIGAFSVHAATRAPQGFVHSFEPNPPTFKVLHSNLSGYKNVTLYPMALGEKEKEINFIANIDCPAASSLEDSGMPFETYKNNAPPQKVKVTTIDSLRLPRLDFLKMDAEGYEANIIRGGKDTIRKFRPVIAMAIHHYGIDEVEIPKLLNSIAPGYSHSIKKYTEEIIILVP